MHRFISRALMLVLVAALAALAAAALAGAATFSNSAAITINDSSCEGDVSPGTATPYPSSIPVSGLTGTVTDVNVTLTGLSHTFPDDLGVLLVGPGGQKTLLMLDVGGGADVSEVNLTFDDAAAASLSDGGPIVSGTFKPTVGTADSCTPVSFPEPAPAGPYGSPSLSVFNGTNPNGAWSLYVIDDQLNDVGSIAGGWSLDITVGETPEQNITDLQGQVTDLGLAKGLTTALNSKLDEALAALDADNTAGACDSMQEFLDLVSAQSGKKLTEEQAEQLTDAANEIRTQLDC